MSNMLGRPKMRRVSYKFGQRNTFFLNFFMISFSIIFFSLERKQEREKSYQKEKLNKSSMHYVFDQIK